MTASRDPDRLIRAFLMEGEDQLQDHVYDAVRDAIDQKRQRVVIGPWRTPDMSKIIGFGLAAAAVVAAAVIGLQLLGPPANLGGPGVEPTATAEPTATPTPAPRGLPEGAHLLSDGAVEVPGHPSVPMTVSIPASGWYGQEDSGILTKDQNADPPDGAGMIVFAVDEVYVYGDPCAWSTSRPESPATTVDEVIAALAAQASRDASDPVDITLDGHAGKAITLHVPDDAVLLECDGGTFGSWGIAGPDEAPYRYAQGPGQIDEVWVVDVDGTLVLIDWAYYGATPQVVVDELRAIVESITFEAP